MKIYTITLHGAHNFGAMLQAYALRMALQKMGHDVQIINYLPAHIAKLNKKIKWTFNLRGLVKSARGLLDYRLWKKRYDAFESFKKEHFNLTECYRTLEELQSNPPLGDAYICGSDQIWNPERPLRSVFFLDFGSLETKRISYAASFGVSKLPDHQTDCLKELLQPFDALSVRESSGVEIIHKVSEQKVELVLDPTLLLDKDEWMKVMSPTPIQDGEYMLVYCLEESPLFMRAVEAFAKESKLPVVVIGGSIINRFKMASKVHVGIGPSEFLRLFADATLVVTNSFHGTAFALNYGRPLVCVPHTTRNDRMSTLMESIGWPDSQCDDHCDVTNLMNIAEERAREETQRSLLNLRMSSVQFLEESLMV